MIRRLAIAVSAVLLMGFIDPSGDRLADPAAEARAEKLFTEIRCVVCQNESIAASEADLAHDLRMLVRAQVADGRSNAEIKDYLFRRYGDFILLKPRLTPATVLLWAGPFLVVAVGLVLLVLRRRRVAPLETELTEEEIKALKKLDISGAGQAAD